MEIARFAVAAQQAAMREEEEMNLPTEAQGSREDGRRYELANFIS